MNRIVASALSIIVAAVIVVGSTGAFFGDTEQSLGNTFAAGVIDLKIDNESYYNHAVSTSTSWELADLTQGLFFFNFADLKPDDEGEDTISLHIGTNPAWACMDVTLTSNDDRSSNEPELATGDAPEDVNNTWDGELADALHFVWWADDGDNVFENGETLLSDGVQTLTDLATTSGPFSVALADSGTNVWSGQSNDPLDPAVVSYIGKAWCFGDMTLDPYLQDGLGTSSPRTPANSNGGINCNGTVLGNQYQTDGVTLDVAFRALQARDIPNFSCKETQSRTAELTVIKNVINDNGGNNVVADFQLYITNSVTIPVTSGTTTTLVAGTYRVTEDGLFGYTGSFGGDCDVNGFVTLNPGDHKTCTITNNDNPASIYLFKSVTNDNGGIATPASFLLRVDGAVAPQGSQVVVTSNAPHTVNEDARAGYHFQSISTLFSVPGGLLCPAVLGGTVTLPEGAIIFCQINNDDDNL